jgi:hypothetical protein
MKQYASYSLFLIVLILVSNTLFGQMPSVTAITTQTASTDFPIRFTGSNLNANTVVSFNGIPGRGTGMIDANTLETHVPPGNVNGVITIANGTDVLTTPYTFTLKTENITITNVSGDICTNGTVNFTTNLTLQTGTNNTQLVAFLYDINSDVPAWRGSLANTTDGNARTLNLTVGQDQVAGIFDLRVLSPSGYVVSNRQRVNVGGGQFYLPPINALGPDRFCQGQSVELEGPLGNFGYLWSTGETTRVIRVTTQDTYTLRLTAGSCQSSPGFKRINVERRRPRTIYIDDAFDPIRVSIDDFDGFVERFAWFFNGERLNLPETTNHLVHSQYNTGTLQVVCFRGPCADTSNLLRPTSLANKIKSQTIVKASNNNLEISNIPTDVQQLVVRNTIGQTIRTISLPKGQTNYTFYNLPSKGLHFITFENAREVATQKVMLTGK